MEYKYNGLKSPLWGGLHNPLFSPFDGSAIAGGGSEPLIDPATLYTGGKKGIWIKPRGWTTLFQNSGGTGAVTTAGDAVGRVTDQSGRGNHMIQANALKRPLAATVGSVNCIDFDGSDDNLPTATFAAGTLTATMDCFFVVNRDAFAASGWLIADAGSFFGVAQNGSGSAANSGAGSPVYNVNGVAVPGGTAVTRDQLYDALPANGVWAVIDACGLDLSAWLYFEFGGYATFQLNGKVAEMILCESTDSATRARIRTYLGSHVGLTL